MEMLRARRWGCFGLVLLSGGLGACHSSAPEEGPPPAPIVVPTPAAELSVYANAASAAELTTALRADLDRHLAARAFGGLEAFAFGALVARQATHADLVLKDVRPVLLFQHHGGTEYIGPTKELQALLATQATRELEAVYSALKHRDMSAIESALQRERALLHEDTVRMSPQLAAHARFFDGVLGYSELAAQTAPLVDEAHAVVRTLEGALGPFAETGQDEPFFLALVLSAEALELVGDQPGAVEFWMQAAESRFWSAATPDLQVVIQGRISSYSAKQRAEVAAEVDDEWTARVAKINASAKRRVDEANGEVAELKVEQARQLRVADEEIAQLELQVTQARARASELAQELLDERLEAERQRELTALRGRLGVLQAQLGEARRAHDQMAAAETPDARGPSVFWMWQASL